VIKVNGSTCFHEPSINTRKLVFICNKFGQIGIDVIWFFGLSNNGWSEKNKLLISKFHNLITHQILIDFRNSFIGTVERVNLQQSDQWRFCHISDASLDCLINISIWKVHINISQDTVFEVLQGLNDHFSAVIYCWKSWVCQWNNLENRLIFDEVLLWQNLVTYFWNHSVVFCSEIGKFRSWAA